MLVFADFTEKYMRPYGGSGSNFTTAANCTNSKTEIQKAISEMQTVKVQI